MNEITIFQNQEFGAIRTMSNEQGEPLFCAKDVCDALGYKQTHKAVERHVDEGDGMKRPTPTSIRQTNCHRDSRLKVYK